MLPTTTFLDTATSAWTAKKLEDETASDKDMGARAQEVVTMLTVLFPELKEPVIDGDKVIVDGCEFLADYDTATGSHAKKTLYLLQRCPKCGAVERYHVEYLWNVGQVIQDNYIGTRHVCIIQAVPILDNMMEVTK